MNPDFAAIHSAIVGGLPRHARWLIKGTPLDYDFSPGHQSLRPLSGDDNELQSAERGWLDLLIFGEYDYAGGGGANPFLGVRKTDGAVYGLDLERHGEAMFLLNSSIERFIQTFTYLNGYLRSGDRPAMRVVRAPLRVVPRRHRRQVIALRLHDDRKDVPPDVAARVQAIDPEAYPDSDWKVLVNHVVQLE